MTNTYNNIKDVGTVLSKWLLGILKIACNSAKSIDKEPEESFGKVNGYNVGDTININIPAIPSTQSDNLDITSLASEFQEGKKALALDKTETIRIDASSLDLRNDISPENLLGKGERVLKPAMIKLGNIIESRVLELAADSIYNTAGTAGSTVFDTATILSAKDQLLVDFALWVIEKRC
jgi:hypothetical protein